MFETKRTKHHKTKNVYELYITAINGRDGGRAENRKENRPANGGAREIAAIFQERRAPIIGERAVSWGPPILCNIQ